MQDDSRNESKLKRDSQAQSLMRLLKPQAGSEQAPSSNPSPTDSRKQSRLSIVKAVPDGEVPIGFTWGDEVAFRYNQKLRGEE